MNIKIISSLALMILMTLVLLFFNNVKAQGSSTCGDLEYLKITASGLACSALPGRRSNTYVESIINSIVNPAIPAPPSPVNIPTCDANKNYAYTKSAGWGCKLIITTETPTVGTPAPEPQIELIGCPSGQFLNRITGGKICALPLIFWKNHEQIPNTITLKSPYTQVEAPEFYANSFFHTSDLTLKENLKPLNNQLDKIEEINGYYFNFKEGNSKKRIGFIAQEIEKVYPELVSEDRNGIKSVDYTASVPILLESLKELNERINNLEEKLTQQ